MNQVSRRFGGVARLYGEHGLQCLTNAHVCVIGIGGVGSWAVESLARSGVGEITMIDLDVVAESNINRQLMADTQTLGRAKVSVMQERIERINPACQINSVDDFISAENISHLLPQASDFVIDCVDDFRTKAALIAYCKRQKLKLLVVGGAGGQRDPSRIRQTDLSRTQQDVLLARTRKLLRQDFAFARNPKRSFGIPCVYSDEQLVYPDGSGGISAQRPADSPDKAQSNALNCAGGLGSITHITATFGLFASAYVLNTLVSDATT